MTSILGHQKTGLLTSQQLQPRLSIGQNLQVSVLGATRHGVSVKIGRDTFQLDLPPRFAEASTLTLQGTTSSSATGQIVQVVARDDRPLSVPIAARLTSKAQTAPAVASSIVQRSQVDVVAQPVSPDGKVLGASVNMRLQVGTPETAAKLLVEQAAASAMSGQINASKTLSRMPNIPGHQSGHLPNASDMPGADGIRSVAQEAATPKPIKADISKSITSDAVTLREAGLASKVALKSNLSVDPQPMSALTQTGSKPPPADLSVRTRSAAASTPKGDGEASSTKNVPVSSASTSTSASVSTSTQRNAPAYELVVEQRDSLRTSLPVELRSVLERDGRVVATVAERTTAGQIVLKVAGQFLRIEKPIDLPLGTSLHVILASGQVPSAAPIDPNSFADPATPLTKLIELLDAIDRAGQQVVDRDQPLPARSLPGPDKHLAARFLGLLPTEFRQLEGGEQRLSPNHGNLPIVQKDQIQALVRDLSGLASESLADGWRSTILPVGSDPAHAAIFYYRDHSPDSDEEAPGDGLERTEAKRAVFDVSFSRLGRCQIDALCQQQRFDLLIRNEKRLSPQNQKDISALFVSACEIAGLKGEIGFLVGNFFEPARSSAAAKDLSA